MMVLLPWWVASLISNVMIIYVEAVNRGCPDTWVQALPRTAIPILIAQWCLWRGFSGAPHWLIAWAFFTVGNAVMRVGAISLIGTDKVNNWGVVLVGIVGMILSSFVMKKGLL